MADAPSDRPLIGILCWEAGVSPRGLVQLEALPGNSTNPASFDFPVHYCRVRGANLHTILEHPSREVLQTMIQEARRMAARGIRAITTSCGFNAVFQRELADAVDIPVFTSSLIQIPMVWQMLGKSRTIGVITANRASLSEDHLRNVGIGKEVAMTIQGLETCTEWGKIFTAPDEKIDLPTVARDVIAVSRKMLQMADIGAFVLECTDLPPFAEAIRRATGRPVFDFVTMTNWVYQSVRCGRAQ